MAEASVPYAHIRAGADYILDKIGARPEIALVLGSGLGPVAERISDARVIPYGEIPHFLVSTAPDHAGELIFGELNGREVVCMSGRFHHYEGYDFEQLAAPVRVLRLIGVEKLILTNAAGAVNESFTPGDIMLITDHIKLFGASPVRGPNMDELGPRFFDVSDMYTGVLRERARAAAERAGVPLREGVYFYFPGPQFETPAEIRAARILGGDAVGMSTVTEALTAAHCGMQVLGLSLITNMAAGVSPGPVTAREVGETAALSADPFQRLILEIVPTL